MAGKDLYSVMVDDQGVLKYPSSKDFFSNINGVLAAPKEVIGGATTYLNKVGSKGWHVNTATINYNYYSGNKAVLGLANEPSDYLTTDSFYTDAGENIFEEIDNGNSLFTEDDGSYYGFYGDLKSGDRLTIIVQSAYLSSDSAQTRYEGDCQLQAVLKVIGYAQASDGTSYPGLLVELDTSAPYCDTVFSKNGSIISLERIFNAWIKGYANDAILYDSVKAILPDKNTVRVYGKPELGIVDVLNSSYILGVNSEASGEAGFAQGRSNKVSSTAGAAFGRNNTISGYCSVAFGNGNWVYGEENFTSGVNNTTYGLYNSAFGHTNKVGDASKGDKCYNLATGYNNTITGQASFAAGNTNNISGISSASLGTSNLVHSNTSLACGSSNEVNSICGCAIGNSNKVISSNGGNMTFGYANHIESSAAESILIGSSNYTNHTKVYEFGVGLKSSDRDQVILGRYNATLPTDTEFAIGVGTSEANRKTLISANTTTLFVNATINATKLFANNSPVVTEAGCNTLIIGSTSGDTANTNTGNYKLTVGNSNTNSVENGIVGGKNNVNSGAPASTFLFGEYLKCPSLRSSIVVGTYNDPTTQYLFSVGAGTADNNRKNCFAVKGSELYANVNKVNINVSNSWNIGNLCCLQTPNSITQTVLGIGANPENFAGTIKFFDSGASSDNGQCAVSLVNKDNKAIIGVAANLDSVGNQLDNQHIKIIAKNGIKFFESLNEAGSENYANIFYNSTTGLNVKSSKVNINDTIVVDNTSGTFQVPIFDINNNKTSAFATIKVKEDNNGGLTLDITRSS